MVEFRVPIELFARAHLKVTDEEQGHVPGGPESAQVAKAVKFVDFPTERTSTEGVAVNP
jgi:hypothetical protein